MPTIPHVITATSTDTECPSAGVILRTFAAVNAFIALLFIATNAFVGYLFRSATGYRTNLEVQQLMFFFTLCFVADIDVPQDLLSPCGEDPAQPEYLAAVSGAMNAEAI